MTCHTCRGSRTRDFFNGDLFLKAGWGFTGGPGRRPIPQFLESKVSLVAEQPSRGVLGSLSRSHMSQVRDLWLCQSVSQFFIPD